MAKRFLLESFDVARACARRTGELLVGAGVLEHPDDVFYLTVDELANELSADVRELVADRRAERVANPAPVSGLAPPPVRS